jgi:hypothetical protein
MAERCLRCQGRENCVSVTCSNTDCNIYYRRQKTRQDRNEIEVQLHNLKISCASDDIDW